MIDINYRCITALGVAAALTVCTTTCLAQTSGVRFAEIDVSKQTTKCTTLQIQSNPNPDAPVISILFTGEFVDLVTDPPKALAQRTTCSFPLVMSSPTSETTDLYMDFRIVQIKTAASSIDATIKVGNQRHRIQYGEGWIIEGSSAEALSFVRIKLSKLRKGVTRVPVVLAAEGKRPDVKGELLSWEITSLDICAERAGEMRYCAAELDKLRQDKK